HHGSKLSPSWTGQLASYFVRLPKSILAAAQDVVEENPDLPSKLKEGHIPTSVELLAPNSPPLMLLANRPKPDGVRYHSIIAVAPPSETRLERLRAGYPCREEGDGVVSFRSAHLEGVDSEFLVPADHTHVHHHPLAVREVRRILTEHCQPPPSRL